MNHAKYFTLGVRVANFSDIALPVDHLLEFDSQDINAIVKKIRQYADLPVVFVVSGSQARQIPANLAALKTIRSPCFPHALFTVGDTDLTVDDTEVDIVRIGHADALAIQIRIDDYVSARLRFDDSTLRVGNSGALPAKVDKKIQTVTGAISGMYENGVVVDGHQRIDADIVVNCIGFERNASLAHALCGQHEMTNINYVDKDFMYLADAYIDDDAFNSLFGSSVLEMAKFYLEVYIRYFDNPQYSHMMETNGITTIPIEDRKWSHYISGATALIHHHPDLYEIASQQVAQRTGNFLEKHDLETYIEENKREWIDLHSMLAGKPMRAEECMPYVFEKLLPKK